MTPRRGCFPFRLHEVASPDGRLRIAVGTIGNQLTYKLVRSTSGRDQGQVIGGGTLLDLAIVGDAPLGELDLTDAARTARDESYTMPAGKRSTVRDHCRELTLTAREREGARREVTIIVRAYDDGIAFRYRVPAQLGIESLAITGEGTQFTLPRDADVWALPVPNFVSHYEYQYETTKVDALAAEKTYGLPLLAHASADGPWLAFTESDLIDHAATYVRRVPSETGDESVALAAVLSPPFFAPGTTTRAVQAKYESSTTKPAVITALPHASPWRVILVGDSPGALVESDLVQTLAAPSRIADTSWIKPGKISFLWWNGYVVGNDAGFVGGLDTRTLEYYIDFAAEQGVPYVSIDGFHHAWYGGPNQPWLGADITRSIPELDLPAVFAYAKSKGVRIRFWVNTAALRAQMETAIPLYAQWGAEGIMADFVERDDQTDVAFQQRLVELCAANHLTVTFHNCPKPTGLTRTYPNLLTYEAVRNTEYNKFPPPDVPSRPEHELIVPFVRMLAGPLDYHSGGFRAVREADFHWREISPLVIGTRCRELARYVVYEDPMPMLADDPATYRANLPTFAFLRDVPTTWDETRVLSGEVGHEIVVARRKGDRWYLGAMTDSSPRELKVSLSFLGRGHFEVRGWRDGPADADPNLALAVERTVTSSDTLDISMGPAGGYAVMITPK